MRMIINIFFLAVMGTFSLSASAVTIEKNDFPETAIVNDKKLVLNGAGVRKVDRFGLTFKVYASALYTEEKTTDANAVMNSTGPRMIMTHFLRRVSSKEISEPLAAGIISNCLALFEKEKCEKVRQAMKPLTDNYPDMLTGNTAQYWYYADKVDFDIKGRKEVKGTLNGPEVTKSLLGFTLGPKAASEEFKKALLGLSQK